MFTGAASYLSTNTGDSRTFYVHPGPWWALLASQLCFLSAPPGISQVSTPAAMRAGARALTFRVASVTLLLGQLASLQPRLSPLPARLQ